MSDAIRRVTETAAQTVEWATRRTIRIGVTGLARAGKTAFLTSVAANLLALGAGRPVLPALAKHLGARRPAITIAPAGASAIPRFDHQVHLAALTQDPPAWPARTNAASLLALDITISRRGLAAALPQQRLRLEFLDYPGEWLLDLPLLRQDFATWSEHAIRRLETRSEAAEFLVFLAAIPSGATADEALAAAGHRLYRAALERLRDSGLALLQPGRFLMPAPGPEPAWLAFFPYRGHGNLNALLSRRYQAYVDSVQRDLSDPLFGKLDRMVVLVDLLSALHAGPAAFADTVAALAEAAAALRWRRSLLESAAALARLQTPPRTIARVAFAATKADHVGSQQRGNLAALLRHVVEPVVPVTITAVPTAYRAIAAVRCTADEPIDLAGRAVSGVIGRQLGDERPVKSYPGEVPSEPPGPAFWQRRFLQLPNFEPLRPLDDGRGGIREIGLDTLLLSLLDDVL